MWLSADAGANNSKYHHGNAQAVLVKAGCWCLCSRGTAARPPRPMIIRTPVSAMTRVQMLCKIMKEKLVKPIAQ